MTSPQFGRGSTLPTLPHFVHVRCASMSGHCHSGRSSNFTADECETTLARSDAVDKKGREATRLRFGRRAVGPIAQSRIRLSTPRHGAIKTPPCLTRKSHNPLRTEQCRAATGGGCGYVFRRIGVQMGGRRIARKLKATSSREIYSAACSSLIMRVSAAQRIDGR
jgi:hypothetical protein